MESYETTNMENCSRDIIKQNGLKFDFGKIKSEKYGEAILSGHLLFMTHEEIPSINVKAVEEKAYVWATEMGLEPYVEKLFGKAYVPAVVAHSAVDADPEKLEVYFKALVFSCFLDDGITKLNELHKNDPIKHEKDTTDLVKHLISIINSRGDSSITQVSISKLNPVFKLACKTLSHTCRCSLEQMGEHDYKRFAKEMAEFIKVNKWFLEYQDIPYTEQEYYRFRLRDIFTSVIIFLVCFAKNIRVSDEIRMHPVFQRYHRNIIIHSAICNDMFSLRKEIAKGEEFNIVLIYCQRYSLQRSIHEIEKVANELAIDLQKDKIRLLSYFPTNDGLKKFIRMSEHIFMGAISTCSAPRYGNVHKKIQEIEFSSDYNTWLEQWRTIEGENMEETQLSMEPDNSEIPSIFL